MTTGFPPLVEPLGRTDDPAQVCARFLDLPYVLFLDSAATQHADAQYSFLAADPLQVVRSKGPDTEIRSLPGGHWTPVEGDALGVARALLPAQPTQPVPGLPPFQGGIAGYIGYDWGAVLERLPRARYDDLAVPDVVLGLYDWVIAWDHRIGTAWLISTGLPESGEAQARRARERMDLVRERLGGRTVGRVPAHGRVGGEAASARQASRTAPLPRSPAVPSYPVMGIGGAEKIGLRSTFTHRAYLEAVARVREYILAGDIFQANLSQRFQCRSDEPPFELYQRLRHLNPAPFAAYLGFDEVAVLSASPERFLRLDEDRRRIETRPIKGTRPRGLGPMHDAALGRALAESEKDRAENVMIVDLLRNDLSRVCRPGSVRVPELFALEHHPTVHHLVSTVVGEIEPGSGAVELIRATFPGGSITGAPKVRAMEIIAELEPTQRGVYCGSIGYVSATGAMDTSIVIRTYLALGGQVYFQAGGGIVADSDPELEYRETLDKARGLIETLVESHQSAVASRRSPV
ncbi:MAG TPA: aminodeoxychorismate synthase component I [Gemmatimonadales bacterium]|nr:aminodeoxychorismate synthase component I [Gemmatimonadales bacterium]